MIEEMEFTLRSEVEEIYIKKTQEIIDKTRITPSIEKHSMEQSSKLKDLYKDDKK